MDECGRCGVKVGEDAALLARGTLWHVNHLMCDLCSCRIHENERCASHSGLLLCEHCHLRATRPKCHGCSEHIVGHFTEAMGHLWHPSCFQCTICHHTLLKTFVTLPNKQPAHQDCFWELKLKLNVVQKSF
ncbi:unnamed protein product [Caenorhabditis auriculariae]|uniref:LIM zinc-binding domain-containing protein n=1 Tax=Caenorhabditis auriculariae TaxID=2777116 RepID=A0A8S1HI33_9PELO|nr:unnamed protein product [Caenorhabditis auriculariae]